MELIKRSRTVISVDDAELGRHGANEGIVRGRSCGAGPVSCLFMLGARESYGAIIVVVAERGKLSYW